jgi:hypothetical protein
MQWQWLSDCAFNTWLTAGTFSLFPDCVRSDLQRFIRKVEIKITECLWAKTFRAANAADIGYATICYSDFAGAVAFNPKMRLVRTKTLMQGHDCCNHRWVLEA